MHYGFRIVEHLTSGLEGWMREKGYRTIAEFVGRSVPRIKSWGELDLNYKVVARIDQEKCIHCGLCYIACEDGCHQSIRVGSGPHGRLPGGERLAERRDPLGRVRGRARGRRWDDQRVHDQGGHVRRLQHVQPGLPGRGLHHDAARSTRAGRR